MNKKAKYDDLKLTMELARVIKNKNEKEPSQNEIIEQMALNEEIHKVYQKQIEEFKIFFEEDHTGHKHASFIRDHKN